MAKEFKHYYIVQFDKRGIEKPVILDNLTTDIEKEAIERFEAIKGGASYYKYELRRILNDDSHLLILEKRGGGLR